MTTGIEDIFYKDELLAKIVRHTCRDKGLNFFTPEDNPLQFGVLQHPTGYNITPHIHRKRQLNITEVQEVLYVEVGMVEVVLYSAEGELVREVALSTGDTILLMRGGHGFHFTEDSTLIYVKQGPYMGREEDKKLL